MKDYSKPKMPWHTIIFLIWLGLGAVNYIGSLSSLLDTSNTNSVASPIAFIYAVIGIVRILLIFSWINAQKFSRAASLILLFAECIISIMIAICVNSSALLTAYISCLVPVAWIAYLIKSKSICEYLSLPEQEEETANSGDDLEEDS